MFVKIDLTRKFPELDEYLSKPVTTGDVLLYGSSFFTVWGFDRVKAQLGKNVLNHGFGGSTGEDQLYHYHQLVKPYAPKSIVLRGGLNDLFNGYTPEQAAEASIRVLEWAKADFPDLKAIALAIFDFKSECDRGVVEKVAEYNRILKQHCDELDFVDFLDISEIFYKSPADVGTFQNFRDIFVPDGLHLTDAGYEIVAPYFLEKIQKLF